MLKLSKSKLNQAVRPGHRQITTHNMIVGNATMTHERLKMLDCYGQVRSNLGIVTLNREHRYNTLTPHFAADVSRAIDTMNIDHVVESILMKPAKGEHFSNGTDFRTIAHMKKEQSFEAISRYLEQIYQLQAQMAKLNKPLIAVAPGHSFNSGATLLAASGFPMTTLNSQVAFNECTFGFVPHSGATYYLSRLPGDFGTFLALTGMPIHGSEAARLDITRGVVHLTKEYEEEVADIVGSQEWQRFGMADLIAHHPNQINMTPWEAKLTADSQLKTMPWREDMRRAENRLGNEDPQTEEFIEARDRIPSSVGEAEHRYMQLLRKDRERQTGDQGEAYLEFGRLNPDRASEFAYVNRYKDNMDFLAQHITSTLPSDRGVALKHKELIARCFYANSVEEIIANLQREQHPFAKKCLEAMKNNSMLSMKLALKMLRRAINLDYTSCMQMEVHVAIKKVQDKDFDFGVYERLMKPKPKDKTKITPFANEAVTDSQLEAYFEPSKFSSLVNIGTVQNALLPTRHYYQRFTDVVRLWINQESTTQGDIRQNFDREAKEALRMHGIDTRDKALTVESARDHLGAELMKEHTQKVHEERMSQLMCDEKLREKYFGQINSELEKYTTDSRAFYQRVNEHIQTVFEQAYLQSLSNVFDKSKEAHDLEKRRMLIRLKRFLFKSRILHYVKEEDSRTLEQLKNFQFKFMHLTEKWDQNWRDQQHPYIHKSPIYHISKAVGRVSLTQPELAREYLTKPENREHMTALTFDKEELEKLQKDILTHPDKYIELLTTVEPDEQKPFQLYSKVLDMKPLKLEEHEYWYRMINDGRCPLDSYPYYKEFNAYKEWVESIESKAYDTLLFTVNSLLLSLQDAKHTFEGKKDSRRSKIERLQNMLEDRENVVKKPAVKAKRGSSKRRLSENSDVSDLKSLLQKVLKEDNAFKHMFANHSTENASIKAFQGELESELLKLIEIVLLNKHGRDFDPKLVQKELAHLLQAKGWNKNGKMHSQHLNLIDSYLAEVNGAAAVQEALDLVKPFFFKMVDAKMKEEANKVLEQFHYDDTVSDVLTQFYFTERHGDSLQKSWMYEKWHTFNKQKQDLIELEMVYPLFSRKYRKRTLDQHVGISNLNQSETIAEQQLSSLQDTQNDLNMLKKFDEIITAQDKEIAEKGRAEYGGDFLLDPRLNEGFFDEHEEREIDSWNNRYIEIDNFIQEHLYEVNSQFTEFDFLHIYAKSILKQNMAFGSLVEQTGYDLQDRTLVHEGKRTDKHWTSLAEYADFLQDFKNSFASFAEEHTRLNNPYVDVAGMMVELGQSQESIFQKVMAEKNANVVQPFDRKAYIRDQIAEFNSLQDLVQKQTEEKNQIRKLIATRPKAERESIESLLQSNSTFLDLTKLKQKVTSSTAKIEFESVFDVDRLIQSMKAGKSLGDFMTRYSEKKIDVISLEEMSNLVKLDSSLNNIDKAQIASVLEHVKAQTKYMAHGERKNIALGSFLSKHHYTSSQAYSDYADEILKKKLFQVGGKKEKIVDWQIGDSRTNPVDHFNSLSQAEITKMLDDIYESTEQADARITELNDDVNAQHDHESIRNLELRRVLRDALEVTKLPAEHEGLRNYYENEILYQLGTPDMANSDAAKLVEHYIDMRMKTCLMNPEFNKRLQLGDNGHIYMKVLRERTIKELNLTEQVLLDSLSWESKDIHETQVQNLFDVEAPYELQAINNTDALGYDNLLERAQQFTKEGQFDGAQKTVMDKLMADYFLDQRTDYVASNKMVKDLVEIFESEERKTKDVLHRDAHLTLEQTKLKQGQNKVDAPLLVPENFRELMELDQAVGRAMQKGKNGLSNHLRSQATSVDDENWYERHIPEYFELYDVRKPADKYVDDKLYEIISQKFEARLRLEKGMSRRELLAFDQMLSRYLQKSSLLPELHRAISRDYHNLDSVKHIIETGREREHDFDMQVMKIENTQQKHNKEVINPDAKYKWLAYGALAQRKAQAASTRGEKIEAMYNDTDFPSYYKDQLILDQKRPVRPINPADYVTKKPWEVEVPAYQKSRDKEVEFVKQHGTYIENKKEQQDRIQLFYVLEQFFEQSRTTKQTDKQLSQAQQHMEDYFSNPDNTFFFDKNKIY